MSVSVQRGQRIDLTKNQPTLQTLDVGLTWEARQAPSMQSVVFLLDETNKVANADDVLTRGQTQSEAVEFLALPLHADEQETLRLHLDDLPTTVQRLAITLASKEEKIQHVALAIYTTENPTELLRFTLNDTDIAGESAVVLGEIYRYKGAWKFNAVGKGYVEGIDALSKNFGFENAASLLQKRLNTSPKETKPPYVPSSSSMPVNAPKKVILQKGQKVNLVKQGKTLGEIVINLNWHQGGSAKSEPEKKAGFFSFIKKGIREFSKPKSNAIDLDLGCLFELTDGRGGAVQALGNAFGSLNAPPYIALDGDDRSGSSAGGETMRVNGKMVDKIRRILVYTFIYDGVVNWADADGVVTLHCPGGPELIIHMDEYDTQKAMCALALLENKGDGTFSVEKLVRFFDGHRSMDKAYQWGLRWAAGSKD